MLSPLDRTEENGVSSFSHARAFASSWVVRIGRQPRTVADGLIYHALNRGNHRPCVFFHDADFQQFLMALAQTEERYPFRLYAYWLSRPGTTWQRIPTNRVAEWRSGGIR
jgi:hypothetical protein